MTTATKSKPASAELEALQKVRDKARAKALEAQAAVRAWDDETEAMKTRLTVLVNAHPEQVEGVQRRVRPGTEAAKLRDEIKGRLSSGNPHRAAYDEACAPFGQADHEVQRFQLTRLDDRLAELGPDADRALDRLREGFALIEEACDQYGEVVQKIRDVVIDTPGLTGRDYGYDPRPQEWRLHAQRVLDGEIARPGLTPTGAARAASHV
jgi:hypothetical protein